VLVPRDAAGGFGCLSPSGSPSTGSSTACSTRSSGTGSIGPVEPAGPVGHRRALPAARGLAARFTTSRRARTARRSTRRRSGGSSPRQSISGMTCRGRGCGVSSPGWGARCDGTRRGTARTVTHGETGGRPPVVAFSDDAHRRSRTLGSFARLSAHGRSSESHSASSERFDVSSGRSLMAQGQIRPRQRRGPARAREWGAKVPPPVQIATIKLLNRLEAWCMYLNTGLADSTVMHDPCAAPFMTIVVQCYARSSSTERTRQTGTTRMW
jgi:hypothetical protein